MNLLQEKKCNNLPIVCTEVKVTVDLALLCNIPELYVFCI